MKQCNDEKCWCVDSYSGKPIYDNLQVPKGEQYNCKRKLMSSTTQSYSCQLFEMNYTQQLQLLLSSINWSSIESPLCLCNYLLWMRCYTISGEPEACELARFSALFAGDADVPKCDNNGHYFPEECTGPQVSRGQSTQPYKHKSTQTVLQGMCLKWKKSYSSARLVYANAYWS